MLKSEFWEEMAGQFRTLDSTGCLSLEWTLLSDDSADYDIVENGYLCRDVRLKFEVFATRCGAMLPPNGSWGARVLWYGALCVQAIGDRKQERPKQKGRISDACIASADLCEIYQAEALEKELEEEMRRVLRQGHHRAANRSEHTNDCSRNVLKGK